MYNIWFMVITGSIPECPNHPRGSLGIPGDPDHGQAPGSTRQQGELSERHLPSKSDLTIGFGKPVIDFVLDLVDLYLRYLDIWWYLLQRRPQILSYDRTSPIPIIEPLQALPSVNQPFVSASWMWSFSQNERRIRREDTASHIPVCIIS